MAVFEGPGKVSEGLAQRGAPGVCRARAARVIRNRRVAHLDGLGVKAHCGKRRGGRGRPVRRPAAARRGRATALRAPAAA